MHFYNTLLLSILSATVIALPEPANPLLQQNHHQVGFVLPPHLSAPYGKSLPPSSPSYSRAWGWTQWLTDAKSVIKSLLGAKSARSSRRSSSHPAHKSPDDDERNVVRFDNDIVLRINVSSLADCISITELAESMILDVWSMTPSHVDIRIPRTSVKGFLSLLPNHITEHEPIITNLRAAVDYTYPSERTNLPSLAELQAMTKSEPARQRADDIHFLSDLFFSNYQSYATITQWLHLLESLRPELVQVVNIGESYEGREILGVVIKGAKSSKPEGLETQETVHEQLRTPGILMNGAQHAREWISVSTVCYIAYQLVTGYYVDDSIRKIVDKFEWSLFPVLNVDGYEYSWTTDRLWRKNRQPTPVPFCTGLDPDRSWGYMWDAPGSEIFSSNPCSESYRGEKPFQSVESKLMSEYIYKTLTARNVQPEGYVDFHSYSQSILYPFAYDCDVLPRDAEDLAEAAWGAAKAARDVHGRYFDVGSACEGDNFAVKSSRVINGGAAADWAYAVGNIPYSYNIRLRDTGNHGFLLPRNEIVPSGEEMFAMAKHLVGFILERP